MPAFGKLNSNMDKHYNSKILFVLNLQR